MATPMNLAVKLSEYLGEAEQMSWRWSGGVTGFMGVDCSMFMANWLVFLGDDDPGKGLRGTYRTREKANEIVDQEGGMATMLMKRMPVSWHLIDRDEPPRTGDVGVISAMVYDGQFRNIPAIHQEGLWLARALHGIRGGRADSLRTWRRHD